MTAKAGWTSRICTLIAAAMLLGAQPAFASDTRSLDREAVEEYNAGLDAEDSGQNQSACRHYRNAEALWHNAGMSLMGWSMQTEGERDGVKRVANQMQGNVDKAKQKAAAVCGLSDGPARSSSSSTSNDVDWNAEKKRDLQKEETLAKTQYRDATAKADARDMAGACASARLSADGFTKIANAMKADRALETSFANPAQIYANAEMAAELRDMFCPKAH